MKHIIIYNDKLFWSPRHFKNYLANFENINIDIKYLNVAYYKQIKPQGLDVSYEPRPELDSVGLAHVKSCIRSGTPLDEQGNNTPLDVFTKFILPKLNYRNKLDEQIKTIIDDAVTKKLGTKKDYEELIKNKTVK